MQDSLNPVDVRIGARIRHARLGLNLTRAEVAAELGLTLRQFDLCESGAQRFTAMHILALSRRFKLSIRYFFATVEPRPRPRLSVVSTEEV